MKKSAGLCYKAVASDEHFRTFDKLCLFRSADVSCYLSYERQKESPVGDEYRLHRGGLKSRQKIREVLSLAASAVIAETAAAEEQQDDDQAAVIATSASVTASAESVTAAAEE